MKLNIFSLLTCLIGITCPTFATVENSTDVNKNVVTIINNMMHTHNIPGAAVVVYKDGKMHQYVFGVMNRQTKTPVTPTTIFELGSITKNFTGLLLAEQVNAGKMRLNDKLAAYLEDKENMPASINQITLLELATHTSGFPYSIPDVAYNASASPKNSKLVDQFLQTWNTPYPAGSKMRYSNFGFAMLGQALANHAAAPLIDEIQTGILQPLKMKDSYLTVPKKLNKHYAEGYTIQDKPAHSSQGGLFAGSWAMKSSISDMTQYLRAAIGLEGIPADITMAMKTAQSGYFEFKNGKELGLGWDLTPLNQAKIADLLKIMPLIPRNKSPVSVKPISNPQYISNALIEKTGATDGFRSYIGVIPAQKVGVVILINKFIANYNVIEHTGREIILQ